MSLHKSQFLFKAMENNTEIRNLLIVEDELSMFLTTQ